MSAHSARFPGSRPVVVAVLALLIALVAPAAPASAAGEKLEVSRELTTAPSGQAVELTASMTPPPTGNAQISFEVENGPGDADGASPQTPDASCSVSAASASCVVSLAGQGVGASRVRAWIEGEPRDDTEGRLAGTSVALFGYDDCRGEVDPCRDGPVEPGSVPDDAVVGPDGDSTDVVAVTWGARLDCDDSNPGDGEDTEFNLPGQAEAFTCALLDAAGAPVPAAGTAIDAEIVSGANDPDGGATGTADFNNLCTTGPDGRCGVTLPTAAPAAEGEATICFWVDGDNDDQFQGAVDQDGAGCVGQEQVQGPEGDNQIDLLSLDWHPASAARGGVDVQPDLVVQGPGGSFRIFARVYDQFGQPVTAPTPVRFELFAGSPYDRDANGVEDGNTPQSPDRECTAAPDCSVEFLQAFALGHNLICAWTNDTPQVSGDSRDGTCDGEGRLDATGDDGLPIPANDDHDVVDLFVQSRPALADVAPRSRRQSDSPVTLTLTGVGFVGGARVSFSGTGITVRSTEFVSANQIRVTVSVPPGAPGGARDVVVTNADGGTATCTACFQVVGPGYWLVASDGGIFSYGDATFHGSTGGSRLNRPMVGMAGTPSGLGYWLVADDGGVFSYGDAVNHGSAGALRLAAPVVGMAATPTGNGYWLVASDGGIFNYGDARYRGSTGRLRLNAPMVGMAPTPNGNGYWLVAGDGGIFDFGNAQFLGSTGSIKLNKPIVGMAATPSGNGYWLVASDGGIFAYGDAPFLGSTGAITLNSPVVGMAATPSGNGYWLVAADGGIFAYGDAAFFGSAGGIRLERPVVGMARR